jgi:hypothetical protein
MILHKTKYKFGSLRSKVFKTVAPNFRNQKRRNKLKLISATSFNFRNDYFLQHSLSQLLAIRRNSFSINVAARCVTTHKPFFPSWKVESCLFHFKSKEAFFYLHSVQAWCAYALAVLCSMCVCDHLSLPLIL